MYVDGRVSTFIELGVGFNLDLPARDNILINATMLGLPSRDARRRVDAVLDFAELHEFVDLKLKNYSSGMLVRLAFSVMIQVDADILLIDEVLAVGDAAFQQKCFDEFARLRRENRTVVLVTHDMGAVERFCDRAMLLERGHVVEIGEPRPVSMHYLQLNFSRDARAAEEAAASGDPTPRGGGRGRVGPAWPQRRRAARGRRRGRDRQRLVHERRGRAGRVAGCRRALHVLHARALPRGRRGAAVRLRAAQQRRRARSSRPTRTSSCTASRSPRAKRSSSTSASRTCSRPTATASAPRSPGPARATRGLTTASASARSSSPRPIRRAPSSTRRSTSSCSGSVDSGGGS